MIRSSIEWTNCTGKHARYCVLAFRRSSFRNLRRGRCQGANNLHEASSQVIVKSTKRRQGECCNSPTDSSLSDSSTTRQPSVGRCTSCPSRTRPRHVVGAERRIQTWEDPKCSGVWIRSVDIAQRDIRDIHGARNICLSTMIVTFECVGRGDQRSGSRYRPVKVRERSRLRRPGRAKPGIQRNPILEQPRIEILHFEYLHDVRLQLVLRPQLVEYDQSNTACSCHGCPQSGLGST